MAGELVVADFQFELRATLFGFGSQFNLDHDMGIRGLGVPDVKTADTPYAHADGAFASDDYRGPRTLALPFKIVKATSSLALNAFAAATAAWEPSSTDLPLYFRVPDWGKVYVNGRPRGLAEDLSEVYRGVIPFLCTFFCPDPTITAA